MLTILAPVLIIGIPLTISLPYIIYRQLRGKNSVPLSPQPTSSTSPESTTPPHLRRTPSGAPQPSESSASLYSNFSTSTYAYAMITPPLSPGDEEAIVWTSSARNFAQRHPHRRMKSHGGDSGYCDSGGEATVGSVGDRSAFGGESSSFGSERRFGGLDARALAGKARRREGRNGGAARTVSGLGEEDDDDEEFVRFGKAATWLRDKVGIN